MLSRTPLLLSSVARPSSRPFLLPLSRLSVRYLSTSSPSRAIDRVTVFGGGLMGSGIAQIAAQAGKQVLLCDVKESAVENGLSIIEKSLKRIASKRPELNTDDDMAGWVSQVMGRIGTTTDSIEGVESADLVVEAIIENMKIKQDLFRFLDTKAPKDCIFASNTSSLSISEIGSAVSASRQAQFAGLHFFNPVPAMKLVEIISTPQTSPGTTQSLFDLCSQMGKSPVTCKDTPGFIVNRLLVPYMLEAIRMVERGEASPKDIDTAMKLGAGYPMGPFELIDFVGLDTTSFIASGWRQSPEHIAPALVAEIPLLEKMVSEGKLGRKSEPTEGGFWRYDGKGRKIEGK